jgi:hypothetical protein
MFRYLLPKSWYEFFLKLAFGSYRGLIRTAYLRFYIYYRIIGDKKKFEKARDIYRVMPYSLVGVSGLSQTYDIAVRAEEDNIDGCFVECGVARGGCSALMAIISRRYNRNRKIWLFDSFEGLPEFTTEDYDENKQFTGKHIRPLEKGSCLGTYEEVEKLLFSKFSLNKKNISLVKGWVQETLPKYKDEVGKISLLRIDTDWYYPTKCCLENLYDNVVDDGFIVIDDYGTCVGSKKALDEFLEEKKIFVELIHDGRGGCYFKKNG